MGPSKNLCAGVAAALVWAGAVHAQAPSPKRPFDAGKMAGRWYEIARLPNRVNKDCQAGHTDWTADGPGRFRISAVCRKGSPQGRTTTINGVVEVANPPQNNRVRMKLLGGVITREYWLLDRADDYGWLIMGTPAGGFISLSSRGRPASPATAAAAIARARALGYDTSALIMVQR